MPRLRPGMARVQFYAVQQEVVALLEQGYTFASAYDLLRTEKKITMCYGAFRAYAKQKDGHRKGKKTPSEKCRREEAHSTENCGGAREKQEEKHEGPRIAQAPASKAEAAFKTQELSDERLI